MKSIISVLPTRAGQRFPRQMFTARDEDSHRQLRQIGQLTRLFSVEGDDVMAGPDLEQLLDALGKGDYLRVNAIFKRHPSYAKVLEDAAEKGRFPNSRIAGTATGWAITLGAAYKSLDGPLFGLAEVSEERFEQAVGRIHRELGDGQQSAVPLPRVLDRTCMVLRISPVRFEVMLNQALGHGALALFEVQRASVDIPIPPHEVIASPTSAAPESYLRLMEPGKGIRVKRTLVSSLVRRSGGLA